MIRSIETGRSSKNEQDEPRSQDGDQIGHVFKLN